MAKRSSDPPGSLPRSQSSGTRNIVRLEGIVAPFAPRGVSIWVKFVLSRPKQVNGHRRPVPDSPSSGTPQESQAKFRHCRDCRRVRWVPGPRGQYSGKIVLSRHPGYNTRGIAMWLNVVLTPG